MNHRIARHIAVVTLVVSSVASLSGQSTGRIEGHVRDSDRQPLSHALVSITGTSLSSQTDANGAYVIENIPAGTVQIEAHHTGFRPRAVAGLRVIAGQTAAGFDFTLAPESGKEPAEPPPVMARPAAVPLLLRFQLIQATPRPHSDPAIAGIDSVLKDIFRFPGYRLLSNAAVAADYSPTRGGSGTYTDQLLNGDGGVTYHLSVMIDTATAQSVRLGVTLYVPITPTVGKSSNAGLTRYDLLTTTVTVSYGRTVVLGSTQPGRGGPAGVLPQTLILTVRPEMR